MVASIFKEETLKNQVTGHRCLILTAVQNRRRQTLQSGLEATVLLGDRLWASPLFS